jgi:hypothetical protein
MPLSIRLVCGRSLTVPLLLGPNFRPGRGEGLEDG